MPGNEPLLVVDAKRWLNETENNRVRELLYTVLNAVDAKAGTLMRFNGFVTGAMALLLRPDVPGAADDLTFRQAFAASFVAAIGAELVCFFIFAVKYRWLRHDGDVDLELRELAGVAERRNRLFQAAWWLTIVAVLALLAGVLANVYPMTAASMLS